ncbi:unnamed protein product [Leuciscus chuanchicus]
MELCDTLEPALQSHTQRSNPVPPHVQVLSNLGFLATGTVQQELADRVGISQPSIQQQLPVKRGFYSIAGLHNLIGAIDYTHVRIKAPSPDPFPYLNRMQYHSINVQVICDSVNHLLNVVSRFPGGAHYSYFMQNSSVGMRLEQGAAGDAWLIGRMPFTWLMTPLTKPQTHQEASYNQRHARTRSTIERTICILRDTGCVWTQQVVCRIIMACCVLHNIAMKRGVPLPLQPPHQDVRPDPLLGPDNRHGVEVRQQIISRF